MKPFYTFLLCLLSVATFSEGMRIRGAISDMDTKKPVSGAFVLIKFYEGVEYSDVTDSLGQYEIKTNTIVPEGYYGVEIDAKEYYKPNGFVHVTKDCFFNFSLKSKTPPPIVNIIPIKDTIKVTPVKLALEGYATNNLVFLIDISSSMNAPEKMPLLKESMKYLVNELRPSDRVAILTFSNSVKEVLSSTLSADKQQINTIIDGLAFGSTSQGGAALDVAYKTALKNFLPNGNNRIVLASDGIFTSGEKDYKKMQQSITLGREKNITLSIFCFGKNTEYVKTKLQKLTNAGSGNFAAITTAEDARLHMLEEAKAVKKQIQ